MSGQLTRFPTVLEPWIFFPLWALSPCSLSNPGCHKTARAFYWGLRQHWAMIYPPTSMSVLIHFTLHLFKETSARGVCASSGCGRLLLPLWFERLNQQFWHLAAQHSLLQVSWAPDNKNTQNSLIYNSVTFIFPVLQRMQQDLELRCLPLDHEIASSTPRQLSTGVYVHNHFTILPLINNILL